MVPNKVIGARVTSLRNAAGQTQEQMAADTGYSRSSIASIEAGHQQIGLQMALTFADHFKIPLDYLLCRKTPPGGPLVGEFIDDLDELALIRFWRSLDQQERKTALRLLRVTP